MALRQTCCITAVEVETIGKALQSTFKDIEDAIQYYSAISCDAEMVLSRNVNDFKDSTIPIYMPSLAICNI